LQDSERALINAPIGLPLAESLGQAAKAWPCLTGKPADMDPSPQNDLPLGIVPPALFHRVQRQANLVGISFSKKEAKAFVQNIPLNSG
jgi:hypothetical protein